MFFEKCFCSNVKTNYLYKIYVLLKVHKYRELNWNINFPMAVLCMHTWVLNCNSTIQHNHSSSAILQINNGVIHCMDRKRPRQNVREHVYIPISGTNSDVAGILSAISSMNTEKASSTVIPSVIFSPESGGNQKPSRLSTVSQRHGNIMLNR